MYRSTPVTSLEVFYIKVIKDFFIFIEYILIAQRFERP